MFFFCLLAGPADDLEYIYTSRNKRYLRRTMLSATTRYPQETHDEEKASKTKKQNDT